MNEKDLRNCLDCDRAIQLPPASSQGEIVSCPDCGESYELDKDLNLKATETEGEDWGE